jgi:hypothetical protein
MTAILRCISGTHFPSSTLGAHAHGAGRAAMAGGVYFRAIWSATYIRTGTVPPDSARLTITPGCLGRVSELAAHCGLNSSANIMTLKLLISLTAQRLEDDICRLDVLVTCESKLDNGLGTCKSPFWQCRSEFVTQRAAGTTGTWI